MSSCRLLTEMKFLIVLSVVCAVAQGITLEQQWQEFKLKHGKAYKSLMEEKRRFAIFQENIRKIEQHNERFVKGEETFKKGINKFADLTLEECTATLKLVVPRSLEKSRTIYSDTKVPEDSNINWVEKGRVTSVREQGYCGSCWAFATAGCVEAQFANKTGKLIPLSPQSLVDCSGGNGNLGCIGGWPIWAFDYIKHNGIPTEEEYPYVYHDDTCKNIAGKKISSFVEVANDENVLLSALHSVGPITIVIDSTNLHPYSKGIFSSIHCGKVIRNHAVLLVGKGTEDGQDYWLVKNSWGADWGEDGYFRLEKGVDACGMAQNASYALA